jgi:hypothetical protein
MAERVGDMRVAGREPGDARVAPNQCAILQKRPRVPRGLAMRPVHQMRTRVAPTNIVLSSQSSSAGFARSRVPVSGTGNVKDFAAAFTTRKSFHRDSGEVEAISVHHLDPRRREVLHKLLARLSLAVVRAQDVHAANEYRHFGRRQRHQLRLVDQ